MGVEVEGGGRWAAVALNVFAFVSSCASARQEVRPMQTTKKRFSSELTQPQCAQFENPISYLAPEVSPFFFFGTGYTILTWCLVYALHGTKVHITKTTLRTKVFISQSIHLGLSGANSAAPNKYWT